MSTEPSGTVVDRATALTVYRLADSLVRFRHHAELEYARAPQPYEFGGENPPVPHVVVCFREVSAAASRLAVDLATPEATALASAARAVHRLYRETWLNASHRAQLAQRQKVSEESDFLNDNELDWSILRDSPLASSAWDELNATAARVTERLPNCLCRLFELGRTLAEVNFPLPSSYDAVREAIPVLDDDYLITAIRPNLACLIREVRRGSNLLQDVQEWLDVEDARGQAIKVSLDEDNALGAAGRLREQILSDLSLATSGASRSSSAPPAFPSQDVTVPQGRATTPGPSPASGSPPEVSPPSIPASSPSIGLRRRVHLSAQERERLRSIRDQLDPGRRVIGMSDPILIMFREIFACCVAGHKVVLLLGPSGSGKTEVAKCLHRGRTQGIATKLKPACHTRGKPLANPESIGRSEESALENFYRWQAGRSQTTDSGGPRSEWVGFAPDSGFNAAPPEGQDGLLKSYEGGTIFIDEFAQMSRELQVFLLDVTEGQPVAPLGAKTKKDSFRPNVHFVLATNEDITNCIRRDLRFRIKANIHIPSLAERIEDVFPLARHFLSTTNYRLTSRTWLLFLRHSWPGNVRELQNVLDVVVGQMRVQDPDSSGPPNISAQMPSPPSIAATSPEIKRKAVSMSKKVPIPFELFASHDALEHVATEIANISEPRAFREVLSVLEGALRAQGYERAKKGCGLDARIAELLGITPVELSRQKKTLKKSRFEAGTAGGDESLA